MSALRACELCGAKDPRVLYVCDEDFVDSLVFKGHRQRYTICKCRQCHLVFVGEGIDDSLLPTLYDADYYRGRDGAGFQDYGAAEKKYRARFRNRLKRLSKEVRGGRVLDVGCALGWFLSEAQEAGFEPIGVEVSPSSAQIVWSRFKIQVHTVPLAELSVDALGVFDLVTLWDTIEHAVHPLDLLRQARRFVRPGGYLVMTTGNHGSWRSRLWRKKWALIRPPKHLFYFTPRSLRRLAEDAGFDFLRIWTEMPERLPKCISRAATAVSENAADIFAMVVRRPLDDGRL
ncbi:class I SAM-dependent methyltransferase [Planctomycetota bacterium]